MVGDSVSSMGLCGLVRSVAGTVSSCRRRRAGFRRRIGDRGSLGGAKRVSDAADGLDDRRIASGLAQLLANRVDVHIANPLIACVVTVPQSLHDLSPWNRSSLGRREDLDQLILGRCQVQPPRIPTDSATGLVDLKLAYEQLLRSGCGRRVQLSTAKERL